MKLAESDLLSINQDAVWNKTLYAQCMCPNCDMPASLFISITLKSIRIEHRKTETNNKACNWVFFYRRIEDIARQPEQIFSIVPVKEKNR